MSNSKRYLETVVQQYAETLLWSGTDSDEDGNSIPLDETYSVLDVTDDAWEDMERDCVGFLSLVWENVPACTERDASDMGRNFALSRNGHGTGFWDLGWGAEGDELHKWAKTFGSQDFYVGCDDKLYVA